jgi:DNA-binding CsgD family transcriptional regulator
MQLVRIGLAAAERAGDLRGCAHMHNDLATASDPPGAVEHLSRARELYERIGDRHGVMVTLVNLGNAVLQLGRPAECVDYSRQALAEGIGEAYAASAAECNLGKGYAALGRHADAVTTFHRALRLCRLSGNPVREAVTLINLGESCLALGQRTEAAERLTAGLDMCRRARYRYGVARALDALGRLQYESGAAGAAAASWREAATVFAHLGERRADDLLRRLRALDPADLADPSALTPAERRIAELVGAGLTNREAAAAAYVSTKTVEVTLTRVYRKLRVRNRTELANQLTHPGGPQM